MADKPWSGRFSEKTDRAVELFTASIDTDRRLARWDIRGSIAHCRMLARQKVITDQEAAAIIEGMEAIEKDMDAGRFMFSDALEDVHMNIEAALTERIGPVAGKLHTGRSRNDQVAVDVRLWLREETGNMIEGLKALRRKIVAMARDHIDVIMPGYTHLQRAQPVRLAHHLMAYYEMFSRDGQRFRDCLRRINVMPLGSAALAGTTYPLDRVYVASLLGFEGVSANSMDAVSDRDFVIEFLADASICMMHFSRLAEEMILWASSEFRFISFSDAFATGSSIMPQKKNPDIPELIRGKTGRVYGALVALLTTMKSLPLAYNRDMQEDKPPLFDAVDTLAACIDIGARMLDNITINREMMRRAAAAGFLNATDMADYLVGKGLPFREAHALAGKAVAAAIEKGCELQELALDELKRFSEHFDRDVYDVLGLERVTDTRNTYGGTARSGVLDRIAEAEKDLEEE
ncbi:MAG: argininosuccinate lyase [Thermodesulfobacteriota bacterium]